jgi:hypothetical protein
MTTRFSRGLIHALRTALNSGILPTRCFALAEHTTPPIVPDAVTLSVPDEDARAHEGGPKSGEESRPRPSLRRLAARR